MTERKEHNLVKDGKGTQFSSTYQPKNPGRKKNIKTVLKEIFNDPNLSEEERNAAIKLNGLYGGTLSKTDWEDIIQGAMSLPLEEVSELAADETLPVGVSIILSSLVKAKKTGEYNTFLNLFARKFGTVVQKADVKQTVDVNEFDGVKEKLFGKLVRDGNVPEDSGSGTQGNIS